jgi:hypothetical protein
MRHGYSAITGDLFAFTHCFGDLFLYRRPEGSFYWGLAQELLVECETANVSDHHKEVAANNFVASVLYIAAREGAIDRPAEILQMCQPFLPLADVAWCEFVLFRTAKMFFLDFGKPLPEQISDAKLAFAMRMLGEVDQFKAGGDYFRTKDVLATDYREYKALIKSRENPYSRQNDGLMFQLFEAVFDAPPYTSGWTNPIRRSRRNLRDALRDYLKSLSSMAKALDRGFEHYRYHALDENSKLISERGRLRSLKPLTG